MLYTLLTNKKVQAVLVALGVVFVLVYIFILFRSSSNSIDEFPIEGTSQDYSTHARIVGGEDLFVTIGGDRRYDSLSQDLYVFGEKAYGAYQSSKTEAVGFQVTRIGELQDQKLTVEGRYGSSKNKIVINITILGNDRISTSITDIGTKFNIDSKLPSNTKLNQFIATLPQDYDGYVAEYSRSTDDVLLFLDEINPEFGTRASTELQKIIDDGSYNKDRFQLIFPVESLGEQDRTL